MNRHVIIVAGGTGTRMGSKIPKQFLLLEGRPVLMHTLQVFSIACPDAGITLVLPATEADRWATLSKEYGFTIPHRVVAGGETRFQSVKNALAVLPAEGMVAIHDGVRPLVSAELISLLFREADSYGNAVPAIPVSESMRKKGADRNLPVDRSSHYLVQTPQVFRLADVQKAFRQEFCKEFTDDATVLESAGTTIHLVEGETRNIKITGPDDLLIAQALIRRPFQR